MPFIRMKQSLITLNEIDSYDYATAYVDVSFGLGAWPLSACSLRKL